MISQISSYSIRTKPWRLLQLLAYSRSFDQGSIIIRISEPEKDGARMISFLFQPGRAETLGTLGANQFPNSV